MKTIGKAEHVIEKLDGSVKVKRTPKVAMSAEERIRLSDFIRTYVLTSNMK